MQTKLKEKRIERSKKCKKKKQRKREEKESRNILRTEKKIHKEVTSNPHHQYKQI